MLTRIHIRDFTCSVGKIPVPVVKVLYCGIRDCNGDPRITKVNRVGGRKVKSNLVQFQDINCELPGYTMCRIRIGNSNRISPFRETDAQGIELMKRSTTPGVGVRQ